jgi:hypothetical protein
VILTLQLVFDCVDPEAIARFWGSALAYEGDQHAMSIEQRREWRKDYPQYDGRGRVDDAVARRMPIYIQKVPEPKTGRNRLRPEIATGDADVLRALGATGTGAELRDVEGNEFTVLDSDGAPVLRSIVFDALDPDRMVEFWSAATGYQVSGNRCDPPVGARRFEDGAWVVDGERFVFLGLNPAVGEGEVFDLIPGLAFVETDEPKRTKNRLHIDLWNNDHEAVRARLEKLGATVLRWDEEHVMADPEGNEFCV